jgi:hypothetical protein
MKKISVFFVGLLAITFALLSWKSSMKKVGATHVSPSPCYVLSEDGITPIDLAAGTGVITPSGNARTGCQGEIPNSTGKAITFNFQNTGIECESTTGTFTKKWHETISASGKVTLQCHFRD